MPATMLIARCGIARPASSPMPTEMPKIVTTASEVPTMTTAGLRREARVRTSSCVLSPNSATKIVPNETASAVRNAAIRRRDQLPQVDTNGVPASRAFRNASTSPAAGSRTPTWSTPG